IFSSLDPHPPHIHTLSLHDALPISIAPRSSTGSTCNPCSAKPAATPCSGGTPNGSSPTTSAAWVTPTFAGVGRNSPPRFTTMRRSEEHTSELQSRFDLVCRLLLEKK